MTIKTSQLAPPDLSLIHHYTKEDGAQYRPTSVTLFSSGQKNLYDINASHVMGADNTTCKTIQEAIARYKPQALVIESTNDKGFSSDTAVSEVTYADSLARKNNIKVIAGEPTNTAVLNAMVEKGYPTKDVMAFYLLRGIPQGKREGKIVDEESFAEQANQFLNHGLSDYHGEKITVAEFKQWYEKYKTSNKGFLDIDVSDITPYNSPDATYFQKLSSETAVIREKHIINTIADSLGSYDNVLVVYGGAHLVQSRPVFEQMFGSKGEAIQLVPNDRMPDKQAAAASKANPDKEIKKKPGFAKVAFIAMGVAGALAMGAVADRFLNKGRIWKGLSNDTRGPGGR